MQRWAGLLWTGRMCNLAAQAATQFAQDVDEKLDHFRPGAISDGLSRGNAYPLMHSVKCLMEWFADR